MDTRGGMKRFMHRFNRDGILKTQPMLVGITGIILGIVLALIFFRIAGLLFQIFSFLFWIAVGIVVVAVVYSYLKARWRGPNNRFS